MITSFTTQYAELFMSWHTVGLPHQVLQDHAVSRWVLISVFQWPFRSIYMLCRLVDALPIYRVLVMPQLYIGGGND